MTTQRRVLKNLRSVRLPPTIGDAGERPELYIDPPLGAPLMIFLRGYILKSFPQKDTFARKLGLGIRNFSLLGELPKAFAPHLPIYKSYFWQTRSHHEVFAYD